jgi:hypothetical protein
MTTHSDKHDVSPLQQIFDDIHSFKKTYTISIFEYLLFTSLFLNSNAINKKNGGSTYLSAGNKMKSTFSLVKFTENKDVRTGLHGNVFFHPLHVSFTRMQKSALADEQQISRCSNQLLHRAILSMLIRKYRAEKKLTERPSGCAAKTGQHSQTLYC